MTLQDNQVLQQDTDGKARVTLGNGETVTFGAGGPYTVGEARNILVGDLWVLAGQSNMEGVGNLDPDALEAPHPQVHSFQSLEQWARAEEPLHWLGESPRPVHHTIWGMPMPTTPAPRDLSRAKGAGLGLTFAKTRTEKTGVPIGLIPAAHGGTSMTQWDPSRRDEGGGSLYGATWERVRANGGKVAGILWYQGESDANPTDAALYASRMTALIKAFRADFGQPDLPFYLVQLGAFIAEPLQEMVSGWNLVREAQRILPQSLPHTAVVSAIDLGLDDGIHIDTAGLQTLGRRLAQVASGQPAPTLQRAAFDPAQAALRVSFGNVSGELSAAGRPAGFSLRDPDGREQPLIYKVVLDGADALLKMDAPPPPGLHLWYGYGLAPYCNIVDRSGASLPAFGPLPLA